MIGDITRELGVGEPRSSKFSNIQKGDLVVYYATKACVVVGIFQVVSHMEYLPSDPYWKEVVVYQIRPVELPVPGNYLDFRKLVADPTFQFNMFPKKKNWGSYLMGKTCLLLTENDYRIIKDALPKNKYLKGIEETEVKPTRWHRYHGRKSSS